MECLKGHSSCPDTVKFDIILCLFMHRNENRDWSNQEERAGRCRGFKLDLACIWIRFSFPPDYCNCSQKSLGELSSMQMPEHGHLSVILVTQRFISIEMANMKQTYSSCRPFLTGAIRPDLWPLGHPKSLQTFTFRYYICLSQIFTRLILIMKIRCPRH